MSLATLMRNRNYAQPSIQKVSLAVVAIAAFGCTTPAPRGVCYGAKDHQDTLNLLAAGVRICGPYEIITNAERSPE